MNHLLTNTYVRVLLASLFFTAIVYIVPWNKIHYGDEKPQIIYRDTTKPFKTNDSSVGHNIAIKAKHGVETHGVSIYGFKYGIVAGHAELPKEGAAITADDSANLDLNNTKVYSQSPMQLYDDAYNTIGTTPRHVNNPMVKYITNIITDKNSNVFINTSSDDEAKNLGNEIMTALSELNYRIIAKGTFGVNGTMPTNKIEVIKSSNKDYHIVVCPIGE